MLNIPFYKPSLTTAEIDEVVETLKSGWLTTGAKTKQFERDFAAYLGHHHAVAVNSCTAALHLALEAIGVQPGDGVLVPTMTFAATAEVVRYMGGNPILVDCHKSDFNLDAADAERRLLAATAQGQRVVAIMPVHYAGQIGDVEGYRALAKKYNLKIIEDAAHCCPAYYRNSGATTGRPDHGPQTSEAGTLNPQLSTLNLQETPHPVPLPIGWGEGVRRTGEGHFHQHSEIHKSHLDRELESEASRLGL
jgi:perosamine synthetase